MDLYPAIFFVSGILAGFAGFLILAANIKSLLNRSWFLFNLSLMAWLLGFGLGFTSDPGTAVLAERIMDGGTIFIPVSLLYFVLILTGHYEKRKLFVAANAAITAVFLALMLFTNFFFAGLGEFVKEMNYYVFDYGWAYYLFLVWFAALAAYNFYFLFSEAKKEKSDPVRKQQLNFVFWGILITFFSGSINFLVDSITIPLYYNLLVPFYLVFVGYAIIRNQLFDIKVIATEILVGAMGFILLVFPFLMPNNSLRISAAIVFAVFCLIGYLLVKTTMEEVNAKESLELKVKERTKELAQANKGLLERQAEVEKWYKLTIGRELRMAELKDKIKELGGTK
ncbi:MAG: histidine kinase N-terminal 7TM domain-containing protein [Candidatus Paceibacterota bacterium]|jgi:MFS family permease